LSIPSTHCFEHYEIAAYGTALAHARLLGRNPVVRLLEATLMEEKAANQALTDIAERVVKYREDGCGLPRLLRSHS